MEHEIRNKKDSKSFLCASYKEAERCLENVDTLQIIPLDFDNDIDLIGYSFSFEDVCEKLEDEGFEFAAYTSFSHSQRNERFRVFIPVSREISIDEYRAAVYYLREILFRSSDIVDKCVYKSSQAFYLPVASASNQSIAKTYYSDLGRPLDIDALLGDFTATVKEPTQTKHGEFNIGGIQVTDTSPGSLISKSMHRRERLLSIICAYFHKGRSIEDTAERIADYDLRYHHEGNGINNGPYFTDYQKHPEFAIRGLGSDGAIIESALKFVITEFRSLERKHGPQKEQDFEYRPIFNLIFE